MKPTLSSFILLPSRRAWLTAAVAIIAGSSVIAQSSSSNTGSSGAGTTRSGSSTGGTSSGSTYNSGTTTGSSTQTTSPSSNNSSSNRPGTSGTSATGSGYHSGTASADADATREINAQTSRQYGAGDKLSWTDRRFVTKVADAGQAEVQLAQLAASKATNPEVRNFAQKLVDDHSKVNSELMSIASQKNVKIDEDSGQDRAYRRLSKKSGQEFDQEFVEHMIDEHEKDIKMFEKAARDAKDEQVRSFASKHVDHLREHLRTAEGLRQSTMPTGRSDSTSGRSTSGGTTGTGSSTSSGSTGSGSYGTGTTGSGSTSGTGSTSGSTGTGSSTGTSGSNTNR